MFNKHGMKYRACEGSTFYRAENPPFGACFTYNVKENIKSLKSQRKEKWNEAVKAGEKPNYPTWEEFRAEDLEESPFLIFTIQNSEGSVVRRLTAPYSQGLHRLYWDFRYAGSNPLGKGKPNHSTGMPVMPGRYYVSISKFENGEFTKLTDEKEFLCKPLNNQTIPTNDVIALDEFRKNVTKLQGSIVATRKVLNEMSGNVNQIINTLLATPFADDDVIEYAYQVKSKIHDFKKQLDGDNSISSRAGNQPVTIAYRVEYMVWMS